MLFRSSFPDEMGVHCNAHANNLVVLVNPNATNLVAPVDFDFAFRECQFSPRTWSSLFPADFDGILQFEQTMGMKTSLAGSNFTSTGVSNEFNFPPTSFRGLLRVMLRDTVVSGFETGLCGVVADNDPQEINVWRSLIYLSLLV